MKMNTHSRQEHNLIITFFIIRFTGEKRRQIQLPSFGAKCLEWEIRRKNFILENIAEKKICSFYNPVSDCVILKMILGLVDIFLHECIILYITPISIYILIFMTIFLFTNRRPGVEVPYGKRQSYGQLSDSRE